MSTIINATTTNGVVIQPDNSGSLVLQTNNGTTALTINTSQNATFAGTVAMSSSFLRNRIINGDMRIDQRNAGASVTPNNSYTLDRWCITNTQTSKLTVQQNAGSVTPPTGFKNYLGVTSSSAYSVLTGDTFLLLQPIEGFNVADLGWGTANAATVTLSFKVYSSLTGTFGGALANSDGSRSYPFSYTISSANTWTTVSVTIAGDTTGTWLTTNGIGIFVRFGLGSGATYSGTAGSWTASNIVQPTGSVSVVGTNGATFYITGVQLEVGSTATPFERRLYNQELANCQRYARTVKDQMSTGGAVSSAGVAARFPFTIPMRATPTASLSTAGSFILGNDYSANYTSSSASIATSNLTADGGRVVVGGFAGLPANGTFLAGSDATGTAILLFSAEL